MPSNYLLMYVSGSGKGSKAASYLWGADEWAELAEVAIQKTGMPLYLIGAHFDKEMLEEVRHSLHQRKISAGLIIQPPAQQLFWLLAHAHFFIGYQSGLNILADNLNTRQLIVYFPHLSKMQASWVKPANRSGTFSHCRFDQGVSHSKNMIESVIL